MPDAQRYSRILGAAKYYSAIDNYLKYITDSTKRGQNVGKGDPRPESQRLYVDPFGIAMAAGQVYPCSASKDAWGKYKAQFAGRTKDAAPSDENLIIKLAEYRPARIVFTTGRSPTGVPETSKVTGMKYLKYGGKSVSIPFGRKDATDTQGAVLTEVQAAVSPPGAPATAPKVTLKPEVTT